MDNRNAPPPRVRLATSIDLSKAKPGCKRCHGSGVVGHKVADLGDGEGEQKIPIICRCVSRNKGVKPDELDRILAEAKRQMDEGIFHENLVKDIWNIPQNKRARAISALMRSRVDERKASESRDAIRRALVLMAERSEWPELRGEALQILLQESLDPLRDDAERELARRAATEAHKDMN